jgi:pSer/pThr/pTyr-binding forkhead associated (FHA) protein
MPELMFFRRGVEALRVCLEHRRMVLGRAEPCDVVIPDPQVSRQHVALHFDGTRCVLEDLSGQGTRVDGEPMKQGELRDGPAWSWTSGALFRLRGSGRDAASTHTSASTDAQPRNTQKEGLPPAQVRVRQGTTEFLHELSGDTLTIGKEPDHELVLQDRFVASHHLRVTRRRTGFHVRDLGSTNDTFLNGARLIEAELALNTVLRVGDTELVPARPPHGAFKYATTRRLPPHSQHPKTSSAKMPESNPALSNRS